MGYLVASRTPDSVHVHHVVVDSNERNNGVGAQLMRELLKRSDDAGRFTLKVHRDNTAAMRFYRRLGFTQGSMTDTEYVRFGRSADGANEHARSLVAVHQPNYIPWCGYFAEMLVCDAFVFFDDAQLPQGRSYVTRAKITRGPDADQWLSAPVSRGSGMRIDEVRFADPAWADAHLRTLHHTYARAAHYADAMAVIEPIYRGSGHRFSGLQHGNDHQTGPLSRLAGHLSPGN